jgi:saccharopine dehydrogenase-like NADP-dependent oxidoreductase
VIEEYTRPARYMENGCLITRPALSDVELIDFPGIGTLEAFNSDGLRTLLHTQKTPNMKEKTLRYPGHCEKMAVLRDSGFFSKESISIQGKKIRPLDFTAQLLFPKWKLQEGEKDITVMQVKVKGMLQGRPACISYLLLDRLDPQTGIHSMARTTGYTATAAARMLAAGLYKTVGVSAPEFIAREPDCVDFMLKDLARHGVIYRQSIS